MVKTRRPPGSILVTVLFMTSILALLVAAVATDSFQSLKTVAQSGRDTQAKYAAYAGMEIALNELRKNETFHGTDTISERHGRLEGNMEGLEKLKYDVLIWNNIQDRDEAGQLTEEREEMRGPEGVVVKPDTVYIVSSGSDTIKGEEVLLSSMAGTATRIRPVFEDAAFARSKLALSGENALVDAWDSQGWDPYVTGAFPGETGGSGGGGGGKDDDKLVSNVEDYKATLGTDSDEGRTLRLLSGAKLNGHYRVGPDVPQGANLFGLDGGTTSSGGGRFGGSDDGGETTYAITTAGSEEQVAGQEPSGGVGLGDTKAIKDTKSTEVPVFKSPVADEDVAEPVLLDNKPTKKEDKWGDEYTVPPAPVHLAPGGYESVTVPSNQTLVLKPGVYYFRDEFLVNGGTVQTTGGGPAIVFCGKKAKFVNAEVNQPGRTASLQLCFTDDLKDEDALDQTVDLLKDKLGIGGNEIELEQFKDDISPRSRGESGETRRGFSQLEISGTTEVHGSISGHNLVSIMNGGEIFGSIMGNVIYGENSQVHQDLALKGSNLMAAGGWKLEGVHQVR